MFAQLQIVLVISSKEKQKKLWHFWSESQLAAIVPGLAGAKVSVGRAEEGEKQRITSGDQHS